MSKLKAFKNWQKQKIEDSKSFQEKAFEEVNELVIKERRGRRLILDDDKVLIDFMSCSYLGLDLDERVIKAASDNISKMGVTFPVARTRARAKSFLVLEDLLNQIFCNSHATIYTSLHLVHLGFLPLLGSGQMPSFQIRESGIAFLLDKHVHSSVQINKGLMGQFGFVVSQDFHDMNILELALKEASEKRITPVVIADSIGSMGGVFPVIQAYALIEKYGGYLYLDDAHGTSVFGENGCGYVLECFSNKFPQRLILASSLAKAFGAIAGIIVLPTEQDAEMLRKYSSTYIFGGPPGLSIIDSAIASAKIHLSQEIKKLQSRLWSNVAYFDSLFGSAALNFGLKSPIRGILVGDEFLAIRISKVLQENGFGLTTAMYPTVERGKSLLRIALSSLHTKDEINLLYTTFFENNQLKFLFRERDIQQVFDLVTQE